MLAIELLYYDIAKNSEQQRKAKSNNALTHTHSHTQRHNLPAHNKYNFVYNKSTTKMRKTERITKNVKTKTKTIFSPCGC